MKSKDKSLSQLAAEKAMEGKSFDYPQKLFESKKIPIEIQEKLENASTNESIEKKIENIFENLGKVNCTVAVTNGITYISIENNSVEAGQFEDLTKNIKEKSNPNCDVFINEKDKGYRIDAKIKNLDALKQFLSDCELSLKKPRLDM